MAGLLPAAAYLLQNGNSMMSQAPSPQQAPVQEPELTVSGKDPIEHKGLFGVKGTLRDILGLLGDTYLIANGRDATYGPTRRREKASAEMAGRYQDNAEESFINNPLLAIQRLAESGYGDQARELYQDYTKNEAIKSTNLLNEARLNRQELRDAQLAKQGDVRAQKDLQETLSRTFAAINDESVLQQFLPIARKRLDALGMADEPLPRNLQEAARYGIDPYRSQRLEDFDEGLSNQRRGQDISAGTQRRGQDISAATQRRGQDMRSSDTRRGQDMRGSGGRSRPVVPPRAPKGKGDRIGNGSVTFVSPDGKRWVREN